MKVRRIHNWILLADLVWVVAALAWAEALRYGLHWDQATGLSVRNSLPFLVATWIIWTVLSRAMQLDGFRGGWRFPAVVAHLCFGVLFVMAILLAGAYLTRHYVSRLALTYFGITLFLGLLALRWVAWRWLRRRYLRGNISQVVIVGSGRVARELALRLNRHPEMLCKVVGFLCPGNEAFELGNHPRESSSVRSVSTLSVVDLLRRHQIDELILALSGPAVPEVLNLAARCRDQGIAVSLVPQPYELYLSKPNLLDLDGLPLLQLRDVSATTSFFRWKRIVDIIGASFLAVAAIPLLAPFAIVLRWKRGASFRWEKRCGWQGREFFMLRLNVDRDPKGRSHFDRIMWQLSLTEVPQLWNVLRGDMSLVGPRPESPARVRRYSEWQNQRLSVRPGMTGLAQVHGLREQHSSEEKTRFDLRYLLHPSPTADLSLVIQTLWTLVVRLIRYRDLVEPELALSPEAEMPASGDKITLENLHHAHRAQSSAN
ncbi:MAG TPA: sugar transferase [Terriglobales bacterium]|nr:sugar transferase [Terriglobales bacterium]